MTNIHFGWVDKAQTVLDTRCLSGDRSLPAAGPLERGETTISLFDDDSMDWGISRGHFQPQSSIHYSDTDNGADDVTNIKSLQVALEEQRGIWKLHSPALEVFFMGHHSPSLGEEAKVVDSREICHGTGFVSFSDLDFFGRFFQCLFNIWLAALLY